jgi:hypothetical protein
MLSPFSPFPLNKRTNVLHLHQQLQLKFIKEQQHATQGIKRQF